MGNRLSGNWIGLDNSTDIVKSLVNSESRLPLPTRLADIETRKCENYYISNFYRSWNCLFNYNTVWYNTKVGIRLCRTSR